jgi:hypothetical protein
MLVSVGGTPNPSNVAPSASRMTGSPVASPPSKIEMPCTTSEPADTMAAPEPRWAVYPAVGTTDGVQFPAVNQSPTVPAFQVTVLVAIGSSTG